jgi:cytoskeletal protein RodZ
MSRDPGPQWNAVPPAGQPPLGEASTKRKKWPFWLAGAVGVIIVLAIIGSLTGGSKVAPSAGTTTTSTPTSTVTTTPSTTSTTPTTASSTAERPSTAKPTFSTQTSVVQRITPAPTTTTQPIPAPPTTATREAEPVPPPAVDPPSGGLNFRSCAEAKKAGFSNMRRGTPGYSANLDRDGDGIACDKVG